MQCILPLEPFQSETQRQNALHRTVRGWEHANAECTVGTVKVNGENLPPRQRPKPDSTQTNNELQSLFNSTLRHKGDFEVHLFSFTLCKLENYTKYHHPSENY